MKNTDLKVNNSACAVSNETPEVCAKLDIPLAKLNIQKTSTPASYAKAGDKITYTVTATNTGQADLFGVDITDSLIPDIDGQWVCKIGDTQVSLPVGQLIPGASIICTGTYTVVASDIGPGKTVNNEACVSTNNFENGELEPGSIRFEQPPLLEDCADRVVYAVVVDLTKTASPTTLPEPGGVFTYTLVIDNDSAVPVVITSLTDTNSNPDFVAKCGILVGTTLAADDAPEPGGADEKTCSYTVNRTSVGVFENTAVVKVKMVDDNGPEATDEAKATVSVTPVPKLTIDKIVKSAPTFSAGTWTVAYDVAVKNTGPIDHHLRPDRHPDLRAERHGHQDRRPPARPPSTPTPRASRSSPTSRSPPTSPTPTR